MTRIGTSTEDVLAVVRAARDCGNRDTMMKYALALFSNRKRRKLTHNSHTVETWHDPHSRSYVTQYLDAEGSQIGDAEYSGTRDSAAFAHLTTLFNLL